MKLPLIVWLLPSFSISIDEPKLISEKLHPTGKLRRNTLRASFAVSTRDPAIEPLRSRMKMKRRLSAVSRGVHSGSSSSYNWKS